MVRILLLELIFLALHHAREPLSLTMIVYTMTKILYEINHNSTSYTQLLTHNQIWIIPVVNIDGYKFFQQHFEQTGNFSLVRKNRRKDNSCWNEDEIGVDLNRNYDYKFGYDDIGSSNITC